jgi:two-component system LytT family response regulator
MPAVIFVTAYDEYALQAFDVHALDYVLKPVEPDRLLLAVKRAKQRLRGSDPVPQLLVVDQLRNFLGDAQRDRPLDRIAVKVDGKHLFLVTSSIDWIEAVDDYVRLHIGRTSHLVRGTLQAFEKQLPTQFLRIHRSAIVNTSQVREASSTLQGDYRLTLHDGTRLPSGRSYRAAVADFLKSLAVDTK